MHSQTLQSYLGHPDVHRTVLAGYEGPYSLGVGKDPRWPDPVLVLQVGDASQQNFPAEIKLGEENVPIVVRSGFKVPVPLETGKR